MGVTPARRGLHHTYKLISMGKMQISIPDDIEKKLRESIPNRKKGDISNVIAEALKMWLAKKKAK